MKEILILILGHPFGFFLVCFGIAIVLYASGTPKVFPILLHFFELVIRCLWGEFTKKRRDLTSIEVIDLVLVIFFGLITAIAAICLLLPSGLAQSFGFGVGHQEPSLRCFQYSLFMFFIAGIGSGTLVVISDKESAVRIIIRKLTGSTHRSGTDDDPPTVP